MDFVPDFSLKPRCPIQQKRQAARVTRQIRRLRGHGLIRKVSGTQRDQFTNKGQATITAILAAQNAGTKQLTELAVQIFATEQEISCQ